MEYDETTMARDTGSTRGQVPFMLLSAAIFAFFGVATSWNYTGVNGQFLLFVALLDWSLKIAAIGFAVSAVLTFLSAFAGNLLYSTVGILSAVMFVIVAVLDLMDSQHTAMHPVLLLVFAAWNGYGSWSGVRETLGWRTVRENRQRSSTDRDSRFHQP